MIKKKVYDVTDKCCVGWNHKVSKVIVLMYLSLVLVGKCASLDE